MPEGAHSRWMKKDLTALAIYAGVVILFGWIFDTDEIAKQLARHSGSKIDEICFGSLAVSLGMLVFSGRRWMEMKSALAREEHFEIERAKAEAISRSKSEFLANMS